jgi:hypothetical protein
MSSDDNRAPAGKHVVTFEKRGRRLHLRCFDENGKELKLGAGVRENIIDMVRGRRSLPKGATIIWGDE